MATQTVQDMVKQVEKQNLEQTAARSVANPGVLTIGGTVGSTPGGQGLAPVPIVNQAITANNGSAEAKSFLDLQAKRAEDAAKLANPSRYNADGSLNTGTGAATASTGSVASATGSPLTQEQYQAQYGAKPVDEQSIREQMRRDAQARIDAINGAYDQMVQQQAVTNRSNEGSTRAINARSGLLGSDFGNANDANQRAAGDRAIKAINLERDAQVSAALAKVDEAATQKIAAAKQEALGNANSYKDYLEKAQTKAKESIALLGKSGVSFDQLKEKDPAALKKILDSTGYSEMELALQLNAGKKVAEKIDWKTDVKGNHVIVYGVNPLTGQMEYHTQELPANTAVNDVKVIDGELWSIGVDGKSATKIGGPGQQDKLPLSAQEYEYAKKNGFTGTYEEYQNQDANRKASSTGSGGGSLPNSYKEWQLAGSPGTYQDWVTKTGNTAPRPLTADQAKLIADGNSLPSTLTPLYSLIQDQKNLFGPAAGRLGALNPYDTKAQTAQSQLKTAAQTIGKYLEGGVLRKEDEDKYAKMLPQLSDTPDVAKNKLDGIAALIQQKQSQYIRDFSSAGFNTSGFESGSQNNTTPLESYATQKGFSATEIQGLRNRGRTDEQIRQLIDEGSKTNDLSMSKNGSGSLVSRNPNPTKVIASDSGTYDFTNYATDPNWGKAVQSHLSRIPPFSSTDEITAFIKDQAPNSPLTGEMVITSAKKFGVDPKILLAIAKQEANFGTLGRAARTYNPGNVGNVDSGANVNWGSWQAGLDALARNISKRQLA